VGGTVDYAIADPDMAGGEDQQPATEEAFVGTHHEQCKDEPSIVVIL